MGGLTCIDLFSGAGGLGIGLEEAGFRTVHAFEIDEAACATYSAALPHVDIIRGDIRLTDFRRYRGVDLMAGGPPCQPFSTGGHRQGRADERDMLPVFVRAVLDAQPRAFLLENVPGLLSPTHLPYLMETLAPLYTRYRISGPHRLNAADYGVPQSRRRMFMIGMLEGHVEMPDGDESRRVPAGSVLGPAPFGRPNTSIITYAKTPDLRPNPYHGQLFNGGGRPIDLARPAPTILASAGGNKTHFIDVGGHVPPYHRHLLDGGRPRDGQLAEGRRLTVEESAALQTFPAGMVFSGKRSAQYTQIGNAVPPRLAAVLGGALAEALSRVSRLRKPAVA